MFLPLNSSEIMSHYQAKLTVVSTNLSWKSRKVICFEDTAKTR